jgi:hypothetical protein
MRHHAGTSTLLFLKPISTMQGMYFCTAKSSVFLYLLNVPFLAIGYTCATGSLRQIALLFSLQGQRLEIRLVPAPRQDTAQIQAPLQRAEKTLRELNDMDPYDFVVRAVHSDSAHNFFLTHLILYSCTSCLAIFSMV